MQPTQSNSSARGIPEYLINQGRLDPTNTEAETQQSASIEEIIPDFVMEHILSQLFINQPARLGLRDLQQARLTCKRWNRLTPIVFQNNPYTAIPVITALIQKMYFGLATPLSILPPHVHTNPIIRDLYASQSTHESSFIETLAHLIDEDSSSRQKTYAIAKAFLDSPLHSSMTGFIDSAVSSPLLRNKQFCIQIVSHDPLVLYQQSFSHLCDDKDAMMAAVQKDGLILALATDRLKKDRDVVMLAVQNNGMALEHASSLLQDDKAIVLTAVQMNSEALKHASDSLKNDKDFIMTVVQRYEDALLFASDSLKNDEDVVMAAVEKDERALFYASGRLQHTIGIVWAARK